MSSFRLNPQRAFALMVMLPFALALPANAGIVVGADAALPYPHDFGMPYYRPGDGVYALSAEDDSSQLKLVDGDVSNGVAIPDGEWTANVVRNNRPHTYVYRQGNQWWRISLRRPGQLAPVPFGHDSDATCEPAFAIPDYAAPLHSRVFYSVAGTDGVCGNTDDQVRSLRLDADENSAPFVSDVAGALSIPRRFYAANGAITGYAMIFGTELRYVDSALANPHTLLTGVRAVSVTASGAVTADTRYLTVRFLARNSAVYRVTAGGGISVPLYSVPAGGFISFGTADTEALYLPAGNAGIARIPFAPSDSDPIRTLSVTGDAPPQFITGLFGVIGNSLIVTGFPASGIGEDLFSVNRHRGGVPTPIAHAGLSFGTSFVAGGKVEWTTYEGDVSSGNPQDATAGISSKSGTLLRRFEKSEWVRGLFPDSKYSDLSDPTAQSGILIRGYTGNYTTDRHHGATLVYADFLSSRITLRKIARIDDSAYLRQGLGLLVGLLNYTFSDGLGGESNDIAVYDPPSNFFSVVTRTPDTSEVIQ